MSLLDYKGYRAVIEYNYSDNIFHGKIFGINDLVSFEGSSVKELEDAFEEAVDDYLETCAELNKEPDRIFKGSFNVRIMPEIHKRAAQLAETNHISLNELVEKAIQLIVINDDFSSHENIYSKWVTLNQNESFWANRGSLLSIDDLQSKLTNYTLKEPAKVVREKEKKYSAKKK